MFNFWEDNPSVHSRNYQRGLSLKPAFRVSLRVQTKYVPEGKPLCLCDAWGTESNLKLSLLARDCKNVNRIHYDMPKEGPTDYAFRHDPVHTSLSLAGAAVRVDIMASHLPNDVSNHWSGNSRDYRWYLSSVNEFKTLLTTPCEIEELSFAAMTISELDGCVQELKHDSSLSALQLGFSDCELNDQLLKDFMGKVKDVQTLVLTETPYVIGHSLAHIRPSVERLYLTNLKIEDNLILKHLNDSVKSNGKKFKLLCLPKYDDDGRGTERDLSCFGEVAEEVIPYYGYYGPPIVSPKAPE